MKSPIERAIERHDAFGSDWTFGDIIAAHAPHGVVIIRPDIVLLARPVLVEWSDERTSDPMMVAAESPDCWHIWIVAGDWRRCTEFAPFRLPWVSMHRRGRLIRLPWERAAGMEKR